MRNKLTVAALFAALAAVIVAVGASARTAAAPSNTTPPAVTGTPKVGQTLTVSNGTWTGSPTGYTYQWQRCTSARVHRHHRFEQADVHRQLGRHRRALRAVVTAATRTAPPPRTRIRRRSSAEPALPSSF